MNLVEANVSLADGGLSLQFAGHRLELSGRVMTEHPALASYAGRSLILGIRPECMEDAKLAPTDNGSAKLRVVVDLREALGSDVLAHFRLECTAGRDRGHEGTGTGRRRVHCAAPC